MQGIPRQRGMTSAALIRLMTNIEARGYHQRMRKRARHIQYQSFKTHKEADAADFSYYRSISGAQRLRIGLELMQPFYAAHPGFERIYRVSELKKRPVRDRWGLGI